MKTITVDASLTYDIIIEKGILEKAGELCEKKLGEITTYTIPRGDALRELREIINKKIAE